MNEKRQQVKDKIAERKEFKKMTPEEKEAYKLQKT